MANSSFLFLRTRASFSFDRSRPIHSRALDTGGSAIATPGQNQTRGPPWELAWPPRRPARVGLGAFQAPLSSCHGPQPALNCSCRSDRVTRDGPVALRVRTAQTETRKQGLSAARCPLLPRVCCLPRAPTRSHSRASTWACSWWTCSSCARPGSSAARPVDSLWTAPHALCTRLRRVN